MACSRENVIVLKTGNKKCPSPCCTLIRNTRRKPRVKGPSVPLDLLVHVLDILVREDEGGKWRAGRVRDQAVDPVGEKRIRPLERVREVPTRMALIPLRVKLDVARRRTKHCFPILLRRLSAVCGVGEVLILVTVQFGAHLIATVLHIHVALDTPSSTIVYTHWT